MAGYDPTKTCGDYGGVSETTGQPCGRGAGHGSHEQSGRCQSHDAAAELQRATAKAIVLQKLAEEGAASGGLQRACEAAGIGKFLLARWRKYDAAFGEHVGSLIGSRDLARVDDVEDKVYDRIMADKASPAETIFYLKNRDPERWRDVYLDPQTIKAARRLEGAVAGQPLDPRRTLKEKFKQMAERGRQAAVVAGREAVGVPPLPAPEVE
jgi:hypothetical protein